MPGTLKRSALNLLAVSIAFCFFFYASKHQPALNRDNPFVEDPYDAVGSFAIQFAVFASVLSLVRAFRSYPDETDLSSQGQLVVAGQMTGLLAIVVTLVANALALSRHPQQWSRFPPSALLLGLMAGLLGWAAISLAYSLRDGAISGTDQRARKDVWSRALPWFLGAALVTAAYPERFRHTLFGAVATVVVGALVLFVPLRVFAVAISPAEAMPVSGLPGDLSFLGRLVRDRLAPSQEVRRSESCAGNVPAHSRALLTPGGLWLGICLCGVLVGCGLAGAELREGTSALHKRLLIVAMYAGLETTAMLLGFALLRRPLRLNIA